VRILIAIQSWVGGAEAGRHEAQRNTFLKRIYEFPQLEYKFFVGSGSQIPVHESFSSAWAAHKEKQQPDKPFTYELANDEVALAVPDGYAYTSYKVREMLRWAVEREFDYVFVCDSDTYICLPRLLASGFEKRDFVGRRAQDGQSFAPDGGPGFFLSKKAATIVAAEDKITFWAEDGWVAMVLREHGIGLEHDSRYVHYCSPYSDNGFPEAGNKIITTHCGGEPPLYKVPNEWYTLFKEID
jgi:hypothetical protein